MARKTEKYELGRDVTHLARSNTKRETGVISVRLPMPDIARLEEVGRESGKTVSQVIRDAIAAYRVKQPVFVLGLWSGSRVVVGEPEEAGMNASWEVNYSNMTTDSTGTTVAIQT